jgi:hypothetical protein
VDTLSESAETRVDASDAGTEVAKVFPSKSMLGLAAVEALADVGIVISPAMARRPVRTIAVVLLNSGIVLELRTVDIAFPSMVRFVLLKLTLGLRQEGHWYQQAVNNLGIFKVL